MYLVDRSVVVHQVIQLLRRRDRPTASSFSQWLEHPLSAGWCIVGWIAASSAFFGLVALLGGPHQGDSDSSTLSTWAIAHGAFSCAYHPAQTFHFSLTAPLYPLLSGGVAALLRIGNSVAFPSLNSFGPHCITAFRTISSWSARSHAENPTLDIGYVSWIAVLVGIVTLLRASARGRRYWEPMILVLVALATPVFMALSVFFHPQDVLALGLTLSALAFIRRGSWGWAGLLLGLAYSSQQFAILALVPLAVLAPRRQVLRFVSLAIGAAAIIDLPIIFMTSGRALTAVLTGTGWVHSIGGTILDEVGLSKSWAVLLSRVTPIICSATLAWWARRQLGSRALEPVPLISLICTSFCFRLIFEVNLWGYYVMATAVTLVILDAAIGQVRSELVCWLALVVWTFNPVIWASAVSGMSSRVELYVALPIVLIGAALLFIVLDVFHHRIRLHLLIFVSLLTAARAHEGWRSVPVGPPTSVWYWQLVLIPIATVWAVRPLIATIITGGEPNDRRTHSI